MGFCEFFVDGLSGSASNMNGGHIASNKEPPAAPSYSQTNGSWNASTGVYTPTSGNPSLVVNVGDYANVFNDGSTTPVFIGLVVAVNSTTITISTTIKSGTAPTTSGTGVSINVGGRWSGPSGSVYFPFQFIHNTATDALGQSFRVNVKNVTIYQVTAQIFHNVDGPGQFEGYQNTAGDGKLAIFDGGITGSSFNIFNFGGNGIKIASFQLQNNGAPGDGGSALAQGGGYQYWRNCVFCNSTGTGLQVGASNVVIDCKSYNCNTENTVNFAGFTSGGAGTVFRKCYSHNNSGSNNRGFDCAGNAATLLDCIADSNGQHGFIFKNDLGGALINCKSCNNGGDGLNISYNSGAAIYVTKCKFISNAGSGINNNGSIMAIGDVIECGFGTGNEINSAGNINETIPTLQLIGNYDLHSNCAGCC